MHLLRGDADQDARLEIRRGVMAEDEGVLARDPDEAGDRADQRGFAGAVRAKEAEEGAGRNAQAERVERARPVGVDLGQALGPERGMGTVEVGGHGANVTGPGPRR